MERQSELALARASLITHGVMVDPPVWDETLVWYEGASRSLQVPAEAVCSKYLNLIRDRIHEYFRR